ncbi:MAG: Rab family GTPase [Candidatus Hermodarchaeota archaeon]
MSYDGRDVIYSFKIVICGANAVGKTCLFNRYCFNSFDFDASPTIGINFHSVHIKINFKDNPDDRKENYVVNSIFDFGGQERFKPLLPRFIEGANGALLVFDLVNRLTFNQLDFWYEQIIKYALNPDIPILLVGSKSDLIEKTPNSEIVLDNLIQEYVKEQKLDGFFKTSSLENYNVLEVFKELNDIMLKKLQIPYVVA